MEHSTIILICYGIFVIILSILAVPFFITHKHDHNKPDRKKDRANNPHLDVAICILSARNNTLIRNSIRYSWLTDMQKFPSTHNKSVIAKFVVGTEGCDIHPENRISPYSCERWMLSLPNHPLGETFMFIDSEDSNNQRSTKRNIMTSALIKTMHRITVKRLGISQYFPFDKIPKSCHIVLYDATSEDEIGRARFSHTSHGYLTNGFYYKTIEEVHFPKHYEFILQIELFGMEHFEESYNFLSDLILKNSSFISFPIYKEQHYGILQLKIENMPHESDSKENWNTIPFMSMIFTINTEKELQEHAAKAVEKDFKWKRELNQEKSVLATEVSNFNDILEVKMTDVYRNLPLKLLLCHQWFYENYATQFVIKTDDDCFLNLPQIVTSSTLSSFNDITSENQKPLWWGNFRRNWGVERHGKWREDTFTSPVYPAFACGSGNIVSRSIHCWLANNWKSLNIFQGEDVAMGIWLSAINLQYVQDDNWRCTKSCMDDMFSIPELSANEIVWYWNNSNKMCPSICEECNIGI